MHELMCRSFLVQIVIVKVIVFVNAWLISHLFLVNIYSVVMKIGEFCRYVCETDIVSAIIIE